MDASASTQLADSIPQVLIDQLTDELKSFRGNVDREREERVHRLLDLGHGSCILREPRRAELVQNSIRFLDGKRYLLKAWVVMPNHVHLLVRFNEGQRLSDALHSLKSYTAHELKKLHPEMASIWQIESFDHYIRNEEHYWKTVRYIHENPVLAKLCSTPTEFPWSSAAVFSEDEW